MGGQKLCAVYQKYGSFGGKKFVHLFVHFLAELGAPLSSELLATIHSVSIMASNIKEHKDKKIIYYGEIPEKSGITLINKSEIRFEGILDFIFPNGDLKLTFGNYEFISLHVLLF